MRSISRIAKVHIDTITRLLVDAGEACLAYHDEHVRNLRRTRRVQVDELWSFTYCKEKAVPHAKKPPTGAGDTWTWTALDADSKLLVSWLVGPRDGGSAYELMRDLADRVTGRIQLTTDGLASYLPAVEDVFGADVDFAQLIKLYGPGPESEAERRYSPATCHGTRVNRVTGDPNPKHVSTSYVERQNLNFRMGKPAVYPAHQRVQQEAGEPRVPSGPVHGVLQLLPDPQDVADDAGHGGRRHERVAGRPVDRQSC